jgi:hypothetical protein
MIRYCPQCDTEKDEEEFHRKNDRPSGRSSWCALCLRDYQNQGKWRRRRAELGRKYRETFRQRGQDAPESPPDVFSGGNAMSDYFSTFKPPVIRERTPVEALKGETNLVDNSSEL